MSPGEPSGVSRRMTLIRAGFGIRLLTELGSPRRKQAEIAMTYQPTERRPIKARGWPIWQRVATGLARRDVAPNGISIAGMFAAVAAGVVLTLTATSACERWLFLAAAVLMQLRLLANLLDGMVAVESGKASAVGELYNEVPDRISDVAIMIGAGYGLGGNPVLGYLAALAALFTAYVRAMAKAAGAPQDYRGPMAKPQRMALLTAVCVYSAVAPDSWRLFPGDVAIDGAVAVGLLVVTVGGLATAWRRLTRAAADLRKEPT